MAYGLQSVNDSDNVLLSSEVTPVCLHSKTSKSLTTNFNTAIPVHPGDGYLTAFHVVNDSAQFYDFGVFSPFGTMGKYYILGDGNRMAASKTINVDIYKYKLGIVNNATTGMRLFNASGVETYNTNNKPINILSQVSIDISDCWIKDASGNYTGQYTNKIIQGNWYGKKIAILFTTMPSGFIKFSNSRSVYTYDIRFNMTDGILTMVYWVGNWTTSFSSAHHPPDPSVKLKFFIIDVTDA